MSGKKKGVKEIVNLSARQGKGGKTPAMTGQTRNHHGMSADHPCQYNTGERADRWSVVKKPWAKS